MLKLFKNNQDDGNRVKTYLNRQRNISQCKAEDKFQTGDNGTTAEGYQGTDRHRRAVDTMVWC